MHKYMILFRHYVYKAIVVKVVMSTTHFKLYYSYYCGSVKINLNIHY